MKSGCGEKEVVRGRRRALTHLLQPSWIVAAQGFGGSGSPPTCSLPCFSLCSIRTLVVLGCPINYNLWLHAMDGSSGNNGW